MGQIRKGHDTMCMVLTSRMRNLDTVKAVWSTGDIKVRKSPCVMKGKGGIQEKGGRSTTGLVEGR